jgi:phospholipid/cholesterol/gamma-HCH transport system substrate-binding protein
VAKRNLAETLTGAVVLVVAAGFLFYAVANSGITPVGGYELNARFDHIDGLSVGSDVRVAGVKVGSVIATRVDPRTYLADVSFTVQDAIRLPTDSSAEITSDGLLGGKYLSLVPGGSEKMIPPDGRVTITQSSVSLESLLGKFIFSASSLASQKVVPAAAQPSQGSGPGTGK